MIIFSLYTDSNCVFQVEILGEAGNPATDLFAAASVNCGDLDKLDELPDLLAILDRYNQVRATSSELKVFPLSLRSCFKAAILRLTEAESEFDALTHVSLGDEKRIGGIVLSSFSIEALGALESAGEQK